MLGHIQTILKTYHEAGRHFTNTKNLVVNHYHIRESRFVAIYSLFKLHWNQNDFIVDSLKVTLIASKGAILGQRVSKNLTNV